MTDFFALLEQPRQPWLDLDALKKKYHQLVRAGHPDLAPKQSDEKFGLINEAYRVLTDPKLRLHHLLALENSGGIGSNRAAPPDLQETFLDIGALTQKARHKLDEAAKAKNDISRSLLHPELIQLRKQTEALRDRLTNLWNTEMADLERLNEQWQGNRKAALAELIPVYERVSYLSRWRAQLKEIELQLAGL